MWFPRSNSAILRENSAVPGLSEHIIAAWRVGARSAARQGGLVAGTLLAVGALSGTAVGTAPPSRADEVAYLVNVAVRPGYNFPNARAALDYGYSLCDRVRAGTGYRQLMDVVKSDFGTSDEYQASYLISQSAQELCPATIWQLRRSAAGYRPAG
jgi:Protein of unknown function (DUF732)